MVRSSTQGPLPGDYAALIGRLDDFADRIGRLETPSGESLGSTLSKASATLKDIQGRNSYFLRQPDVSADYVRSTGDLSLNLSDVALGEVIEFTLQEPRLVRIVVTASISAFFRASDVLRSGTAGIGLTTVLDGEYGSYGDEIDGTLVEVKTGSPTVREAQSAKRARVERYVYLEAGVHTLGAGMDYVQVTSDGSGSWEATVSAFLPVVIVDTLQPGSAPAPPVEGV